MLRKSVRYVFTRSQLLQGGKGRGTTLAWPGWKQKASEDGLAR